MKNRFFAGVALLGLLGSGLAHADAMAGATKATKADAVQEVTVVGEVLDMDCYMTKGLHGKEHQSCAVMCLDHGSPVGLLADDGKAYFLGAAKGKTKAYDRVRGMGGQRVKITGQLLERGGAMCLEVGEAVKP